MKKTCLYLLLIGILIDSVKAGWNGFARSCGAGQYIKYKRVCWKTEPGYFQLEGIRLDCQEECPNGMYSNGYGAGSCKVCEAGYYCQRNAVERIPCPLGQYSFPGTMNGCSTCPDGYYCPESGQLTPCEPGQLCDWSSPFGSGYGTGRSSLSMPCPGGYYCHLGASYACPSGTYSIHNSAGIQSCTSILPGQARVATGGSIKKDHPPITCPKGYYNDKGESDNCAKCPLGYECNGGAHIQRCSPGTYAPVTGTYQCYTCPESFYCSDPTSWPVACPNGQYSGTGQADCSVIPAGMETMGRTQSALKACDDGMYSMAGDSYCSQCWPMHQCREKHLKPQQCRPGEFSRPGATVCLPCPPGHYCPNPPSVGNSVDAPQPHICPQGTWSEPGSVKCMDCPSGYKCDNTAGNGDSLTNAMMDTTTSRFEDSMTGNLQSFITKCEDYEMTDKYHEKCRTCPKGYACPLQLHLSMQPCGPGFWSDATMDYCQVSDGGYYSPTTYITKAVDNIGYYAEIGMTYQMRVFPGRDLKSKEGRHTFLCKPGYFVSTSDYLCQPSPVGSFAPIAWSSSGFRDTALPCPDGTWSMEAQVECRICPPGYSCAAGDLKADGSPTKYCAKGSYNIGGNKNCVSCPARHECSGEVKDWSTSQSSGATVSPCPIWHYYDPAANDGDCKPCPDGAECIGGAINWCSAGTYSSGSDMACLTCPPGFRCPGRSKVPIPCPAGEYSLGGAQDNCLTCPADYFSEEANAYCSPIPPGFKWDATNGLTVCPHKTYSDWGDSKSAACATCPDGYLCPEKTGFYTQAHSCPRGSYCIAGVQTLCPAGYYGIKERATSQADGCSKCPSGYNCIPGTVHFLLQPCPLGAFCKDGIYAECPVGTTGNAMYGMTLNDCATCPPGTSCGEGSTTTTTCGQAYYCPTGVAAPGLPCPAGTFGGYMSGKTDPSQCLTCPPGYYCPEGSAEPTKTPVGYFNPLQGIDSLDGVQLCPPKYYCPDEAMTNFMGYNCAAGHYCPAGTSSATQFPCPAGTYNDRIDVHDVKHCLPCPKGFKCAAGATSSNGMTQCAIGEFCELGASSISSDIKCPSGTYSPYVQAMSMQDCLPCTPGYFCVKGSAPQTCSAGYYCPLGTQHEKQYPCPQGTWSTATGLQDKNQCTACGVGNYCPDLAMSSASQCAPGYYNDYTVNALFCNLCPAGYSCTQTDPHPVPCAEGYFSERGKTSCERCPLGHYCAVKGTSKVTMLEQKCPAGTFCSATINGLAGGLGSYPNKNSQASGGNACQKYHYCPTGTTVEIPLTTLGYETILIQGAGYVSDGLITPAGMVSQDETVCPKGHYCPAGTRSADFAIKCPKGHYRSDTMGQDISDCGKCPAGFYCPNLGQVLPLDCPEGKFCPEGAERPSDCPLGTYNPSKNKKDSRECTPCDANFYCPILGQAAVDTVNHACDKGFVCYGGSLRPEPTDKTTGDICPAGAYCDATGLNYCTRGMIGIFQGAYEPAACQECEKGYYCFGGDKGAVSCPAGYFCPEGTADYENDCLFNSGKVGHGALNECTSAIPAGETVKTVLKPAAGYFNVVGQEDQMACDIFKFTKVPGQSECAWCEQGFWCRTTALDDPETKAICPAGFYCRSYLTVTQPSLDASSVVIPYTFDVPYHREMCPVGTYQPGVSMTSIDDCLACPSGKACETKGNHLDATSLPDCAAGFFCKTKSPSRYPYVLSAGEYGPCPVGHYCEAGTGDPTPCPAGKFSMQERAISADYCMDCPPGFMCETAGLSEPNRPAKAGVRTSNSLTEDTDCSTLNSEYCPIGSALPLQCYTGYFQDTAGQGYCKECPPGSYCINGTQQNCPKGYYCP